MRSAALFVTAHLFAACVAPSAVSCADGRICPGGTVCDDVHALCVTTEQTQACAGLVEADACTAGTFEGLCDQGVCIAGCGDGTQGPGEDCDDGNLASHDGCSSTCVLEVPTWEQWRNPWTPRSGHAAAYLAAASTLVVFGGTDDLGPTDQQWEREPGQSWRPITIPRPSARDGAAMAYDEQRGRLVLFGGRGPLGLLGDTWAYDGTSWTQLTTTTAPPPLTQAAMAYAGAGRIVLFGGLGASMHLNRTWELDGDVWTEVATGMVSKPSPRRQHAMTWAPFPGNERVLLFGGVAAASSMDTMWQYTTAGGWSAVATTTSPGERYGMSMAYSYLTGRVVLFGGGSAAEAYSDTWEFDGTAWISVAGSTNPPGRLEATMSAMTEPLIGGQHVVLIGGLGGSDGALDDVWAYTTSWRVSNQPGVPPVRGDGELVYDPGRRESVIIGGYREPHPLAETFSFGGNRWSYLGSLETSQGLPAGRRWLAAAYDLARQRVTVFGGASYGLERLQSTNVLGPQGWTAVAGPQPPARYGGALAYAANVQRIVLFGGNGTSGLLNDVWTFDGATWTQRESSGPAPQELAAMAYDFTGERLVLLDNSGVTWTLTTSGWEQLAVAGASPPARQNAAFLYDPQTRALVLYGGTATGDSAGAVLADMWHLVGDEWREVVPVGETPPPRGDPAVSSHLPLRSLLMHSGTAASGRRLNDTWLFQFRSDTPDELCSNAVDDDGDRRVDAADPDCAR